MSPFSLLQKKLRNLTPSPFLFNAMIVSSGGNLCWGQKMMGHSSLKNITEEHFSYITNMSHQDGKKYLEEYEKKVEKCLTGNAE